MDKREAIQVNGFLLVEPPKAVKKFWWDIDRGLCMTFNDESFTNKHISAGNYEIIGLARDLTEDQWKEIVNKPIWVGGFGDCYLNYLKKIEDCDTATESGLSLLKSHSLSPDCLILKKL